MKSKQKIILDFSVKNCTKTDFYQIIIETNESLGLKDKFETELKRCTKDGQEIKFKKNIILEFKFLQRQNLTIIFLSRHIIDEKFNYHCITLKKETELSSLISSPNSIYERPLKKDEPKKNIYCIKTNKVNNQIDDMHIFDFLKSGIKLNVFLSFDFSYGLNRISRNKSINRYSKFLLNLCQKIFHYVKDNSIYLYAFGVKNNNDEEGIFKFSEDENPILLKLAFKTYESKLKHIKPQKNIILSKIIRKITDKIYKIFQTRNYNVLFIFLREIPDINDKQKLIDAFIESSYLPLTIIIIGEGENDFEKLNEYFGEHIKEASCGMERNKRNNILIIDFHKNFNENEEKMIQYCFEEISNQLIQFYDLINISPQKIWENEMESIKESFIKYKDVSVAIYKSYIYPNNDKSIISIFQNNSLKDGSNENKDQKPKENIKEKNKIKNNLKSESDNKINNMEKKEKKYTPGISINLNIDPDNNIDKPPKINEPLSNPYNTEKVTDNPDFKKIKKIIPQQSICENINDNPFGKKKDKQEENKIYKLPEEKSIISPQINNFEEKKEIDNSSSPKPIIENKIHKNNNNLEKKDNKKERIESKIESSTEDNSKTSNNLNFKISTGFRFNFGYSIDDQS